MVPVSFEFFPPQSDLGQQKLLSAHKKLMDTGPEFFSVTYGAGGTTQERTLKTVLMLNKLGVETAPHLSCIGASKTELRHLLDLYHRAGIHRLVALRGDSPSGMGGGTGGDFNHAIDLVTFIRQHYGDHFHIEVAAYPEMHPQARGFEQDMAHFVAKAAAGANSAITQYFYNPDAYIYFVREIRKLGCTLPVIPGIMPITQVDSLIRFSTACGADIPRWLHKRLLACEGDPAKTSALGVEVVSQLCRQLLDAGAPALHFYTLNRADPSLAILEQLQ